MISKLKQDYKMFSEFSADPSQALYIDAFPRSAVTFSTYLAGALICSGRQDKSGIDLTNIKLDDSSKLHMTISQIISHRIIHHLHDPSIFAQAIADGIGAITIIRDPVMAIKSLFRYYSGHEAIALRYAKTYEQWIDIVLEMNKFRNFRPLLFEDVSQNPTIIAHSLAYLGLIDRGLSDESVNKLSGRVISMVIDIEQRHHGSLYANRCSVPLPNRSENALSESLLAAINMDRLCYKYNLAKGLISTLAS